MQTLTIDYRTLLKGFSRSEDYADGGFSPDSRVEVDRDGSTYGLLACGRTLTQNSTNVDSIVYSSVVGKLGSDDVGLYAISSNGKIYYKTALYSSNHSVKHTESVKTYTANSHCIIYQNSIYITSTTDIYRDDGTFTVNDNDWWTATLTKTALTAGVPHKMFEFQNNLYILNGNKIASWNGTTAVDAALTLPTGWVIVDVAVGNDEIILLATKTYGLDVNGTNKIFVWDSLTLTSWAREIDLLTNTVESIVKSESGYYFFTKYYIYYSDGYSYKLIKRYSYIELTNFNKVKLNGDIIYFITSYGVMGYNTKLNIITIPMAYGGNGTNYGIHFNIVKSDIVNLYVSESGTGKHYYIVNNTAQSLFESNKYDFGQPVLIKQVEVLFKSALSSTNQLFIDLGNTTSVSYQIIIDNANSRHTGRAKVVENINFRADLFFFSATLQANLPPIRHIKFHYEPSERNTTF